MRNPPDRQCRFPQIKHLCLCLLLFLVGCHRDRQVVPKTPLRIGMWYWHSPFSVDATQKAELQRLGVTELFVRAATMSYDGDRVVATLRQSWQSPMSVHLVYNFDAGLIRHFADLRVDDVAVAILDTVKADRARIKEAGCDLQGVQIDFDCPTRLLGKYAQMAKRLKSGLDVPLSTTGLTSWIGTDGLKQLVHEIDFFAPQFYEGELPKRIGDPKLLADFSKLDRLLDGLADLDKPIQIGVPSYGQCLIYDGRGQVMGMYRNLSRRDAIRHPAMKFLSNELVSNEEHTIFQAEKGGKNYKLLYRISTAELVAKYIDRLKERRPENCVGAIFYRVPQPGESMAVPLTSINKALHHQKAEPSIKAEFQVKPTPFSAIEKGSELMYEVRLTVTNEGDSSIRFRPDALVAKIHSDQTVEEASPGDFDLLNKQDPTISLLRTHDFVAQRCALDPGERAILGPFLCPKGQFKADISYFNRNDELFTLERHIVVGQSR